MKLARIALTNFGPYEEQEIVFDQPLSIVSGQNAAGKTTIANAIRLSFTVRCPNTDRKGGGSMDNIRLGAKKAEIVAGIETAKGVLSIRTTYGPGATRRTQNIVAGSGKDGDESLASAFEKLLDRQTEALSCCTDSDYFFNPKTEQKDILAALILPTSHEFDAETVALVEKHLGKFAWDKSPVAIIDQVYGAAYTARKEAKAALGAIYIPPQPTKPEYGAGHVQEKITSYRALAAKEAKKIKGGGTVQIGRIEQALEQEKEKLSLSQTLHSQAVQRRGEIDQAMLDGPNVKKAERTAAGRVLWEQLQSQIREFDNEIAAQEEAANIYRELGENQHCPTCTQPITKSFISAKITEHQNLIDAAQEARTNLQAEQNGLGDIVAAETIVRTHQQQTADKLQAVKDVAAATERITAAENAIKTLEAELEAAKAQETAPADTTELDKANAELATWEARLSPALNYDSTLAQIDQATKRQQDQKEKVADLETIVAQFGDNGIKADLIAQGASTFLSTVNEVLSKWGYEAKLSAAADEFTVLTPKGWLPTKQLSGFESLMFKVALQCAIAVHSKLKIVVVDEAQSMIDEQRARLFMAVNGMLQSKMLDCAFILLADNRETAPNKLGVGYYSVKNGTVTRL